MDLLTQGLAGALLARAAAHPAERRPAVLAGGAAGLLADADALIRSASDPLLVLEYHRHFTHALAFVPIGALIAALLLWPLMRRRLPARRLYLFTLLGYATSGLLDACTSYGTQLYWPFSDERVAWSVISIVDPLFSLGLLAALVVAWRQRLARPAWLGLLFGAAYLALGAAQHQRAETVARSLAESRGHQVERLVVKPTLGNLVLWRSVYEANGRFHVDAVRVGPFSDTEIHRGGVLPRVTPRDVAAAAPQGSRLHRDIERFRRFSDDFVVRAPDRPDVLGDIRYANLPDSTRPLWGIELPGSPSGTVRFRVFRDASAATRERFVEMLLPSG